MKRKRAATTSTKSKPKGAKGANQKGKPMSRFSNPEKKTETFDNPVKVEVTTTSNVEAKKSVEVVERKLPAPTPAAPVTGHPADQRLPEKKRTTLPPAEEMYATLKSLVEGNDNRTLTSRNWAEARALINPADRPGSRSV